MKVPSVFLRDEAMPDVAMTPMIDVVFLLLIFFLWTSSFRMAEHRLPGDMRTLRQQGTEMTDRLPQEDFDQIVLRVYPANRPARWEVNGEAIATFGQLAERLDRIASIGVDVPVIVDPDDATRWADVLQVYDLARSVGWDEVQLAAPE